MKRFHVSVAVNDLDRSAQFYSTLFGVEPTVRKDDYAKWMLEDPRLNFSISTSTWHTGVSHLGLQADAMDELAEIRARLEQAEKETFDQPQAECCYARSSKTWVRDPDNVTWETFVTHGQIADYGNDTIAEDVHRESEAANCCKEATDTRCCI